MSTARNALAILTGRAPAQRSMYDGSTTLTSTALGAGLALSSSGVQVRLAPGESGYTGTAAAYRCVALIASNLASVDMVVMAGDEADPNHEVARLWNEGTPGAPYSARVVKEVMYARAELTGQAFAYLDRDGVPTSPPRGIYPIFHRVTVHTAYVTDRGPIGAAIPVLVGFTVHLPHGQVDLLPEEVLWLRYPDPVDPWGAVAPWKAALYAAESDAYARAWQRNMLRQDARPSMIVNAGTVPVEKFDQLSAEWRSKVQGPGNAGKSLLVGSATPIDAKALTFTPAEMVYLESRVANADEIMLAFGVRRDVLFGTSTYENQAAAKTALWSDTLLPKLDTFASEVDRQLIPEPGRTAAWDLSEVDALRDSQDAIIKRVNLAVIPDVLTIDEGRAELGLEPLPNGTGGYTISAYRERVRLQAQADFIPLLGDAIDRGIGRKIRTIRVHGRTRQVRIKVDRAEPSAGGTLAAYDRLESVGIRAIRRLAGRQEQAVMRELNKLRSDRHGPPILTRWAGILAADTAATRTLTVYGARTVVTEAVHPEGTRAAADDLFDVRYWTDETTRALEDFMSATWLEGGERAASQFGVDWDVLDPKVMEAMTARLDVLALEVTTTTRNILESQILQGGVATGESIDDLASRLRTVFTDLETWRGQLIARTEVVGGFNASAHTVAAESGVVATRQWLSAGDGRVRPSHRAQNGHVLDELNERYPNGCLFPGDPSADARETVNCRCVELFDVK